MNFSFRDWLKRGESAGLRRLAEELVNRGIVAENSGSPSEAREHYCRAAEVDPEYAPAYMNLGIALEAAGELSEAVKSFGKAIALDPGYAAAHYNLGLAHLKREEYGQAERSFVAALRVKSPFPDASVGLAGALEGLGRNEEALAALESAIAQREDYAGALFNAGALARKLGRLDAAVEFERRALESEPEHYIEHHRLGTLLHSLDRLSEAEGSYRAALALNPDFIEARVSLASVLHLQGRRPESVQLLFDAVERYPDNAVVRRSLLASLVDFPLMSEREKERAILLSLCREDNVSVRFLSTPIIALLKNSSGIRRLQDYARRAEDPLATADPAIAAFLRDPLLVTALPRILILDEGLERALTYIRRCILFRFDVSSGFQAGDSIVPLEFACALAGQTFFAGYHFFADDDETHRVTILREAVEAKLQKSSIEPTSIERMLSVLSMYEYLDAVSRSDRLLELPIARWSEAFRPVVQQQLQDRWRERQISEQVVRLTTIEDQVSIDVRDQYEEHPYPVWTGSVQGGEPETIETLSMRLGARPVHVTTLPIRVLFAGCGTGERVIQFARQHPDTEILAVDLSLASLSYAARMTEQLGIRNLTYRQADILKLSELDRRFTVIECSGVLHHLNNPMEGWRILVDLLEPDGLMRIGLYSAKAREILRPAMDFIRSLDLPQTADGVRECRRAIMALPDGHAAKQAMSCADFYTLNGCRDLLMHVREHQFTLPEVAACLDQLGLRFLRMECSAETQRRFLGTAPDAGAIFDLEAWDRYEQMYPSTFIGMYSFWCCNKDSQR